VVVPISDPSVVLRANRVPPSAVEILAAAMVAYVLSVHVTHLLYVHDVTYRLVPVANTVGANCTGIAPWPAFNSPVRTAGEHASSMRLVPRGGVTRGGGGTTPGDTLDWG